MHNIAYITLGRTDMVGEAQTVTMMADRLPGLLHELPFEVPSEFPDYSTADDAIIYALFRGAIRDVNPTYEHPPADLRLITDPVQERGRRLLKTGGTALMVATQEGFLDTAPAADTADYRYLQTDKLFIGAPMPEMGKGASLAICLNAHSSRQEPGDSEAKYALSAAWEVRIPNLPALQAFGIDDERVTSMVPSGTGTIVEQFFGARSAKVVRDLPVIRTEDPLKGARESERRQGIIHGAYVQGPLRNRLLTMGAVILKPYKPNSFKALDIRADD
jgi:hypothetical protein